MNLLPSRCLLALTAVVDVAIHGRAAPVAAKALASRHGLMPRQLETMLQDLVRAKILKAQRGPRGGYELARERRRITVGDIVRAAGPAMDGASASKPRVKLIETIIAPALADAETLLLGELDRISVDDLCRRIDADAELGTARVDFTI